ncbi:MAG: hypothetical protein E7Z92_02670 [Cyanobacteria bacterium SIG31]|nr:hypothetical protein [Cyanobacteria bacterium SIG31]
MKVNYTDKRNISFAGLWDSKVLKKGLEFAAKNGTLFAGTTSLVFSTTVRPIAILATPKTDKKNKQVACAKSISSTAIGYFMMLAFSLPLAKSIKNIDKNPDKYLTKEAISSLKNGASSLKESKVYSLATQLFKLGLGFIIAVPKAILTAATTPFILNIFIKENAENNDIKDKKQVNNLTFKGNDKLSKGISKILNKKTIQEFSNKYKDSNFPMHIIAATDSLTTATFIYQTAKNKKLEEKDKKPLIYNSAISTGLSIITSYFIDKITENPAKKFIEKFKLANKNDKKLPEYLEGIKIAKPILIMAVVYYIIIPVLSTFAADRIDSVKKKNENSIPQ